MPTLCTEEDVYDLVGAGKSEFVATAGSAARVLRFILRAEGKIVSETRRNWVDDYANTISSNRELLREASASKAAIDVVKFSGKGFISRTEQETTLDVLTDHYTAAIKTLKDLDTSKIRGV